MTYYHGSAIPLEKNTCLVAQHDGYVQTTENQELELLFESCRPKGFVSRSKAVFLSSDVDLIDFLGGATDYIYSVDTSETKPTKHDLHWYSEADCFLSENNIKKATECAIKYWNGILAEGKYSCPEYLTEYAYIESEIYDL